VQSLLAHSNMAADMALINITRHTRIHRLVMRTSYVTCHLTATNLLWRRWFNEIISYIIYFQFHTYWANYWIWDEIRSNEKRRVKMCWILIRIAQNQKLFIKADLYLIYFLFCFYMFNLPIGIFKSDLPEHISGLVKELSFGVNHPKKLFFY